MYFMIKMITKSIARLVIFEQNIFTIYPWTGDNKNKNMELFSKVI